MIGPVRISRRRSWKSKTSLLGLVKPGSACEGVPPKDEIDRELNRLLKRTRRLTARAARFDRESKASCDNYWV